EDSRARTDVDDNVVRRHDGRERIAEGRGARSVAQHADVDAVRREAASACTARLAWTDQRAGSMQLEDRFRCRNEAMRRLRSEPVHGVADGGRMLERDEDLE